MNRRWIALPVMALLVSAVASPALATSLQEARVMFHVQAATVKSRCESPTAHTIGCDAIGCASNAAVTGEALVGYDVYLVVVDIDPLAGLASAELKIEYGSNLSLGWTSCADMEFQGPGWPASGASIEVHFGVANCQNAVDATDPQGQALALLGVYYVFAYGAESLELAGTLDPYFLRLQDCGGEDSFVQFEQWGRAGFGGTLGHDPCVLSVPNCFDVPVRPVTWGRMKRGDLD